MIFSMTKIYVILFYLFEINTLMIENNSNTIILEKIFKKGKSVLKEKNFIKNLKKRIHYDSIVGEDLNRNTLIDNLFKNKYIDPDDLLNKINYIGKKYDIPTNKFFLECYKNNLLSNLFQSKTSHKLSSVVCFFIFSKYFLTACKREIIEDILKEGLGDDAIDLICKALECAKRILSSQSSISSTLHIIKDTNTNWERYCTEEDEALLYALVLVKRMLCNIDLPFIADFGFVASKYFYFGLYNLNIEVVELNELTNQGTKTSICLVKYITNHILALIEFMNLDLQSKNADDKFQFFFSKYLYKSSNELPDSPLKINFN